MGDGMGETPGSLCARARLVALFWTAMLGAGCSSQSGAAGNDAGGFGPEGGEWLDARPSSNESSDVDAQGARVDAASPDASADAAPSIPADAAPDGTEIAADATVDAGIAAGFDGAVPPSGCRVAALLDGGGDGADGGLPGCGRWISASLSRALIGEPVSLTATGRSAGLGAIVDWNVTGGVGSGTFSNTSVTSATFTCLTPGWVVLTGTDPAGSECGSAAYDQASVEIECDGAEGPWTGVSIGAVSACGVTTAGSARCWGDETLDGVLGDGTTNPSNFPVQVSGLEGGVRTVSVGDDFACALTTGGAVECWGAVPPGLALFGSPTPAAVPGLATDIQGVSAGGESACVVSASQGVMCWGKNSSGQLGNGSTTDSATPVAVQGLAGGAAAVAVGDTFACALSTAGSVLCWGDDTSGALGTGVSTPTFSASPEAVVGLPASVDAIAVGGSFACALTSAGSVYCWGSNDRSQLGSFSGSSSPTPVAIGGLPSDVRAIAAGEDFACALTGGGAVVCWGDDIDGELGDGVGGPSATQSATPGTVGGLTNGVAAIALGGRSACAITVAGDLLCWGSNEVGQIGDPAPSYCGPTNYPSECSPYPATLAANGPGAIDCAPTTTADAGAPDAATGWCQGQGTHTLCEDFGAGVPGKLVPQAAAGSVLSAGDGASAASSPSLLATTSPVSPQDVDTTVFGTFVSPVAGASFQLQADFRVGSDCFANGYRPVTLVRVDYPDVGYTLAYSVEPTLSGSGYELIAGDSEVTPQTPGPFAVAGGTSALVPTDQWATLTLWANLSGGPTSSGGFGVRLLGPNAPADGAGGGLFGPSQAPTSAPTLRIGVEAATHGCSVNIDNVLFDVK